VIAQDEASTWSGAMPGAAAHAGICGAVLPLNQIAPKLVRVFFREIVRDAAGLLSFCVAPEERSGLDLSSDSNIWWKAIDPAGAKDRSGRNSRYWLRQMKGGSDALTAEVAEAMTTNETFFFRDKIPFDHLRETVLPELLQARVNRRPCDLVRGFLQRAGAVYRCNVPEGILRRR